MTQGLEIICLLPPILLFKRLFLTQMRSVMSVMLGLSGMAEGECKVVRLQQQENP